MVKKTKSKARLDKFYKIAKEQGYRSRASFKLIQLNRKYNFLQNASVLIDLCAAPGGWLQVASKYMPDSSIIIGVDLDPIKPIKNCRTFVSDITTQDCVNKIKREVHHMKADVVVCDGAPNVGSNWSKDAYSQAELCVYALRLASKFLKKGGVFITKAFRSNDYHSLIWLFGKFFTKVEASKPEASRQTSAEIFVVCRGYTAPDVIDPRFFDPVYVFKDSESDILDAIKNKEANSIKKVFEKRKRRIIEDDAPLTMFKKISLEDFINCSNPYPVFVNFNQIVLEDKEKLEKYKAFGPLPKDFEEICKDLKLLSKKQVFSLIKWRAKVVIDKANEKREFEKDNMVEEAVDKDSKKPEMNQEEADYKLLRKADKLERKSKERSLIKYVKNKLITDNSALNLNRIDAFDDFNFLKHKTIIEEGHIADVEEEQEIVVDPDHARVVDKNRKLNSYNEVSDNIEYLYEQKRQVNKKEKKTEIVDSIKANQKSKTKPKNSILRKSNLKETEGPVPVENEMVIEDLQESSKFFERDIFNVLKTQTVRKVDIEDNDVNEDKEEENNAGSSAGEDDEEAMGEEAEEQMNNYLTATPGDEMDDMDDDELAEILALSKKMLRKKKRRRIIDDSYNRYNYPEDPKDLPRWFYEDERKAIGKRDEITREDVQAEKERLKILRKRLPKKVLEAKMRIRKRAFNSMKKANQKAEQIFENDSIGGFSKARQINDLYAKAAKKSRPKKKEVFVAKTFSSAAPRKKSGRKFMVVDRRLRADIKKNKKKGPKKGSMEARGKRNGVKRSKRVSKRR